MPTIATAQYTWDALLCEVDIFGNQIWRDDNGMPHRKNGPAIIASDGTQVWYKHGMRHREAGPAIIYPAGSVEYWIDHCRLTEKEFNARELTING